MTIHINPENFSGQKRENILEYPLVKKEKLLSYLMELRKWKEGVASLDSIQIHKRIITLYNQREQIRDVKDPGEINGFREGLNAILKRLYNGKTSQHELYIDEKFTNKRQKPLFN
jgi:hypothetical protein